MAHTTLRELHERRLASMSSHEREAFDIAYRRAALAAHVELDDIDGRHTAHNGDHASPADDGAGPSPEGHTS